jgi:hypothetical protein
MKKNRILQTVLIAVLAICTLGSAFMSILACIPVSTDVEICEIIHASASPLSAGLKPDYEVSVSGQLRNTTSKTVVVERLEIPLETEKGDASKTMVFESITIPARATAYLPDTRKIMDGDYSEVGEITAIIGGEEIFLRNPAEVSLTFSLIPLVLTLVLAFLLVRACMVRYYMYQEDLADAQEETSAKNEA